MRGRSWWSWDLLRKRGAGGNLALGGGYGRGRRTTRRILCGSGSTLPEPDHRPDRERGEKAEKRQQSLVHRRQNPEALEQGGGEPGHRGRWHEAGGGLPPERGGRDAVLPERSPAIKGSQGDACRCRDLRKPGSDPTFTAGRQNHHQADVDLAPQKPQRGTGDPPSAVGTAKAEAKGELLPLVGGDASGLSGIVCLVKDAAAVRTPLGVGLPGQFSIELKEARKKRGIGNWKMGHWIGLCRVGTEKTRPSGG